MVVVAIQIEVTSHESTTPTSRPVAGSLRLRPLRRHREAKGSRHLRSVRPNWLADLHRDGRLCTCWEWAIHGTSITAHCAIASEIRLFSTRDICIIKSERRVLLIVTGGLWYIFTLNLILYLYTYI